jgi:hypothetical protein
VTTRRFQKLHEVESTDEGIVLVPYQFRVNGTSNADDLSGDTLVSATFSEAGEYLCTLRDVPAVCFAGPPPNISNTADDVDLYAKVDTSNVAANGTFTVRCMTGSTETTPTDDTLVSGVLVCKKTTRRARG